MKRWLELERMVPVDGSVVQAIVTLKRHPFSLNDNLYHLNCSLWCVKLN